MAEGFDGHELPPLSGADGVVPPAAFGPPPEIEGYEVAGPLGAGGMGTVWRAVQQSTRREVALKVLGHAALVSVKARARFEREVELASRLEHPHIARIYDSGLYHGLYYYAMELIDGLPLDEYAKDGHLSSRGILELMRAVCRAVQHAHQRGVIHRDLKSSNILVSPDGQPHVLDFGLAKPVTEEEASTAVSVGGEVVGTPAYMSPEQAAGLVDQVDVRSDVYGLGAILYHVLLGKAPHGSEGTRYEVLRRIAEEDIRRPREVAPRLDKELEALLLKALARDPDVRYASAGDLADDIDNYLNDEPLSARAHTTLYFLGKRLKKHRGRVAAAGGLVLTLLAMAVWSYGRVADERNLALAARDDAVREAAKARAAADFLNETIASVGRSDAVDRSLTVREVLDEAAGGVEAKFSGQPLLAAEVYQSIGAAYEALGDYEAAARHLTAAVGINQRLLGEGAAGTLASMQALANTLCLQGKVEDAELMHRAVLEKRRAAHGDDDPATLRSLNDLATALAGQKKDDQCEAIRQQVVRTSCRVQGADHAATLEFTASLANTLWRLGKWGDAERLYREVLEGRRRTMGDEHPDTLAAMATLADALWGLGRHEEAVAMFRQVADGRRKVLGEKHPLVLKSLAALGNALTQVGRHEEAEAVRRDELRLREGLAAKGLSDALAAMNALANELYERGKYADAEEIHGDVLRMQRRTLGDEHPLTLVAMTNLANDLGVEGKLGEAERMYRQVHEVRRRSMGEEHPTTLLSLLNLAGVLFSEGRYEEAEPLYRFVAEARRRIMGENAPETLLAVKGLRAALEAQGK
jgi:tetratricopeptide (TPR) repeat protein